MSTRLVYNVRGEPQVIAALLETFSLKVEDRFAPNDVNVIVDDDQNDDVLDWCDDHRLETELV